MLHPHFKPMENDLLYLAPVVFWRKARKKGGKRQMRKKYRERENKRAN